MFCYCLEFSLHPIAVAQATACWKCRWIECIIYIYVLDFELLLDTDDRIFYLNACTIWIITTFMMYFQLFRKSDELVNLVSLSHYFHWV